MAPSIRKHFPPQGLLETPAVLRALVAAHRHLAELKGVARSIPNERLLVSTLSLQEAQSSSEIENIITTQDALYRYQVQPGSVDPASKEVAWYAQSLEVGFQAVRASGLLRLSTILEIQATLEGNDAGLRRTPGTVLKNERSGEVVYEPPSPEQLPELMDELVDWIHAADSRVIHTITDSDLDPLVRMAVMHHQFETIHPFYDGNGRTGRILNILYLVRAGLLDSPILYLSRYISQTKAEYYALLQQVRDSGEWEAWLLYMLHGIAITARHTTALVQQIARLLQKQKHSIRAQYRFYSQDLINNIFYHPYTKVAFVERDLNVSRATATRYLDELAKGGILDKHRLGRENYYINRELVHLLFNLPPLDTPPLEKNGAP